MPIDFHAPRNRETYASREANEDWGRVIEQLISPQGMTVADVGCGGGIYPLAWKALGARQVLGVDFSAQMVPAASERTQGVAGLAFSQGDAAHTGLPSGEFDVVFQRALIHHLARYEPCFIEARRPLREGGILIVQDRTEQDVGQPASPEHLRGYFFEKFPRLNAVEAGRRPSTSAVTQALQAAGLGLRQVETLWEKRRRYDTFDSDATELKARTGQSILHELSDAGQGELVAYIEARLPAAPLLEGDRWTLGVAELVRTQGGYGA